MVAFSEHFPHDERQQVQHACKKSVYETYWQCMWMPKKSYCRVILQNYANENSNHWPNTNDCNCETKNNFVHFVPFFIGFDHFLPNSDDIVQRKIQNQQSYAFIQLLFQSQRIIFSIILL